MSYRGVIIEESLENKDILGSINIIDTKVEEVTEKHKTPWLKQWTLHMVEIPDEKADSVAGELSLALEKEHPWYADYKSDSVHYIIFRGKIFQVDRSSRKQYNEVKNYGVSLGIPEYQVSFTSAVKKRER